MSDCINLTPPNIGCDYKDGICVVQSSVQTLKNDMVVQNPYCNFYENNSYFTFKVMTLCDYSATPVLPKYIYIPICENIQIQCISIMEKIFSYDNFKSIPFDFIQPTEVPPPLGFIYLRIPVCYKYGKGVSAIYNICIIGRYAPIAQDILISTSSTNFISFNGPYLVPGTPLNSLPF